MRGLEPLGLSHEQTSPKAFQCVTDMSKNCGLYSLFRV
jgi:hypothetical protein